MRVADRLRQPPATLDPDESLETARRLAARHGLAHIPVVRGSRLLGMLGENDLAAVHPSAATTLTHGEVAGRLARIPVQRVLGPEITAVGPRTPLVEAVRLMRTRRLKVLPVVRGDELVGLVTEGEMLALLEELLESATPP